MEFVKLGQLDKQIITAFFRDHWGSPEMVIVNGTYQCDELPGFAAVAKGKEIVGMITYTIVGETCEIISLDSVLERRGIGTRLLTLAEDMAKNMNCTRVKLVTSNDNILALGFYQRRGYRIIKIYQNAIDRARMIKPQIPMKAENGIPIRDELLLMKQL
ncbi:GNAT family N-acetyltransferase [Sediminibacillus halophilus]|uniref:Ribosomal protein S18 acetylase RimI n=1 Tax=Sediminibacillus halophilus TaxID=482461 RepID=A0A1G9LNX1_9BACI|nr:GNAT family N-acetyltransferase [Sediminibacillus halophilus]SDL63679.1 Ribosomal protein S18 acetylase RimI [Sediminibacillus halophilus]